MEMEWRNLVVDSNFVSTWRITAGREDPNQDFLHGKFGMLIQNFAKLLLLHWNQEV